MKTSSFKRHRAGYISFLLVLTTGAILTALMFGAYRRALGAQITESKVQLRTDYGEKEEAILRAIVAITPNRAIKAMKSNSASAAERESLAWSRIFADALALANSQNSLSPGMVSSMNIPGLKSANTGDGVLDNPALIFSTVPTNPVELGLISPGINRDLGGVYPPPLTSADALMNDRDRNFPIISELKQYGPSAQVYLNSATLNGNSTGAYGLPVGTYSKFNRLKYPAINFGYAKPGDAFVAKRNWWAFSMNVADHDRVRTGIVRPRRNFVLSIYEIPTQLPISAASSMTLGQYSGGAAWQNYKIDGRISVGQATLVGNAALDDGLALRRGMTMASGTTVGGQYSADPFATGNRESYQYAENSKSTGAIPITNQSSIGAFFPMSLASESGRAAFIPISRGSAFFDRFDNLQNSYDPTYNNDPVEPGGALNHVGNNTLSSTSWNNYSTGAQQCAMRLDIIVGEVNADPTKLRFQYKKDDGTRGSKEIPLGKGGIRPDLPLEYVDVDVTEGGSINLATSSDIAYGASGGYSFYSGVQGLVTFNNATFGDPLPGVVKKGYVRKSGKGVILTPFGQNIRVNNRACIVVYPERIPAYLTSLGAAPPAINNSLAVNVDYTGTGLGAPERKPSIPCGPTDYGVVLKECGNLTEFTTGFSLVTNMRLFVGDHFNQVRTANIPQGFVPSVTPANPLGLYLPPCSLFAPEKRYGSDAAVAGAQALTVELNGQIGSLAKVDKVVAMEADVPSIRPLDAKGLDESSIAASDITTNLTQIRHPAELPPITMMNWLVLLEEVGGL